VCGTLEALPLAAFKAGLAPPTLIIVGAVVRLRELLAWFVPGSETAVEHQPQPPLPLAAGQP
jgi:hypothetical protein